METDEKRLRRVLDSARACVHRLEAPQGLALLHSIHLEIDDRPRTPMWVEHELIYAGALAAMKDPGAAAAFDNAFRRLSELPEPDPALEMLAHGDFGKYLAEQRAFARAREQYGLAERIAESLEQPEDVARFQMCVIRIDLAERKDPRFSAFQKLKEAARDGYTHVEQLEAWIHYVDTFQSYGQRLLTRMGSDGSVDYFRGVLSEIRRRRSEIAK